MQYSHLQQLQQQLCELACNINVDIYVITFKDIVNTHTSDVLTLAKITNLSVLLELRKQEILHFTTAANISIVQIKLKKLKKAIVKLQKYTQILADLPTLVENNNVLEQQIVMLNTQLNVNLLNSISPICERYEIALELHKCLSRLCRTVI